MYAYVTLPQLINHQVPSAPTASTWKNGCGHCTNFEPSHSCTTIFHCLLRFCSYSTRSSPHVTWDPSEEMAVRRACLTSNAFKNSGGGDFDRIERFFVQLALNFRAQSLIPLLLSMTEFTSTNC